MLFFVSRSLLVSLDLAAEKVEWGRLLYKKYLIWQKIIHFLSLTVFLGSCILVFWLFKKGILTNHDQLKSLIGQNKISGAILLTLLQMVQVVVPIIPISITMVLGYMTLGPVVGILTSSIGFIIGSIVLFLLTRIYGKRFCLLFVKEATLKKYEAWIEPHKSFDIIFVFCMLSPFAPDDILVMLSAFSGMKLEKFSKIMLFCKPISIVGHILILLYAGDFLKHFL